MQPGHPVTAPHRLDPSGSVRVDAVFVGEVRLESPKTLDGSPLEPVLLYCVRYEDGSKGHWAPELVLPAEPGGEE